MKEQEVNLDFGETTYKFNAIPSEVRFEASPMMDISTLNGGGMRSFAPAGRGTVHVTYEVCGAPTIQQSKPPPSAIEPCVTLGGDTIQYETMADLDRRFVAAIGFIVWIAFWYFYAGSV